MLNVRCESIADISVILAQALQIRRFCAEFGGLPFGNLNAASNYKE